MAFSRTHSDSFLFGAFDIEDRDYLPITICHNCTQSLPCPDKCKYYYIDCEDRFAEFGIGKKKISEVNEVDPFNIYYEGIFCEIFDFFIKNRRLLITE